MNWDNTTHTEHILIVDDEPTNLELLEAMLQNLGYELQFAENGPQALQAARLHSPDLIMLDIMMPGMDGYQVCIELKADEKLQAIPVIFVSASHKPIDKVKAFEVGAQDYVTKPLQIDEVIARVKTHLEMARLHKRDRLHVEQLRQHIKERAQAEKIIKLQKDRVENILEGINAGTWEWNVQTGETIFNERWAEIIGYSLEELSPVSIDTWIKYAHPDDLRGSDEMLRRHFAGELAHYSYECRMKHKDDYWVWVLDRGKVISWTADGKPLWMFGTHLDITERKQMEEALQGSEERLRLLIQNIQIAIVVHQADTSIVQCNAKAQELFGLTEAQIVGTPTIDPCWRFLREDGRDMPLEHYPANRVLASRQVVADLVVGVYHPETDSVVWVLVNAIPEFDQQGEISRIIVAFADITELKQAEEALREQNWLLQKAQDIGNLGSWEWNLETNQVRLSDVASRIIGIEPANECQEVMLEAVIQRVHLDDRGFFMRNIELSRLSQNSHPSEVRIIHPDGAERTVYIEGITLDTAVSGGERKRIGFIQDITERKQIEQQRIELITEKERANVLQRFVGDASHDLRTPLTTIKTNLYLLRMVTDATRRERYMDILDMQTAHLHKLLEDMLNMSQLNQAIDFQFEVIDLNALIWDVIDQQEPRTRHKKHNVRFDGSPAIPPVQGNSHQLSRAITHIMENAQNYTLDEGMITIRTYQHAQQIVIEVQDTGMGIGIDELPYIFDHFYRADKARGSIQGGAGLGLAIAKRVVEAHQEHIEVESELKKGSTFRIFLPVGT